MKHSIMRFLVLVLFLSIKTSLFAANSIKDDANSDGTVNVADIVEVVNYIMGNPSNTFVKDQADVNGDGVINATDIVEIVKLIMSPDNNTGNEIEDGGEIDDTEYFQISINGESFTDDTWGGSWFAYFEPIIKNGRDVYFYGGMSGQIMISEYDGMECNVFAGYTTKDLGTLFPKSEGTYEIVCENGKYNTDYGDNIGMVLTGGNMSRRTVTSGSLKITKVSKYKALPLCICLIEITLMPLRGLYLLP